MNLYFLEFFSNQRDHVKLVTQNNCITVTYIIFLLSILLSMGKHDVSFLSLQGLSTQLISFTRKKDQRAKQNKASESSLIATIYKLLVLSC